MSRAASATDLPRKRRGDATPFQKYQDDLDLWLGEEGRTYDAVVKLLAEQHGFECKRSALFRWWQVRSRERLLERITTSARSSDAVAKRFAEENPQVEAGFIHLLKQVAFDLLSSPNPDPAAIAAIAGQALKLRDQELKSEALSLQRDQFKQQLKTKIEAGLDELATEIGNDPEARRHYDAFRAVVTKATA